jgi:hypothetical protein
VTPKQIVIDCQYPAGFGRFWSYALEHFEIRPYDNDEINRLAGLAFTPETDPIVLVGGPVSNCASNLWTLATATQNAISTLILAPKTSTDPTDTRTRALFREHSSNGNLGSGNAYGIVGSRCNTLEALWKRTRWISNVRRIIPVDHRIAGSKRRSWSE